MVSKADWSAQTGDKASRLPQSSHQWIHSEEWEIGRFSFEKKCAKNLRESAYVVQIGRKNKRQKTSGSTLMDETELKNPMVQLGGKKNVKLSS